MAQPLSLASFWIRFDLKKISDGSTFTVRFADFDWSREDATALFSAFGEVHGGLIDVSGFKLEVGEPLPVRSGGTITLNNTRGAYQNRDFRPSDLLKDYQWINAAVIVNSFKGKPDEVGSSGNVRIEFNGVVKDLDFDPQSNQMRINVEPTLLPNDFLGRLIDETATAADGLSNLGNNYGKYMPYIFGTATVPTIPCTAAAYGSGAAYLYGANSDDGYRITGPTAYYAKNYEGNYVSVSTSGSTFPVYGISASDGLLRRMIAPDNDAATPINSRKWRQPFTVSTAYIISNGSVDTQEPLGVNTTYYMNLYVKIYVSDLNSTKQEETLLATATVDMNAEAYTANQIKTKNFYFDKPIVFETTKNYWIEFSIAGNENQVADYYLSLRRYVSPSAQTWRLQGNSNEWDIYQVEGFDWYLYPVTISNNANNNFGFIWLGQQTISGQTATPLNDLSFILTVDGLKDGISGTITGIANGAFNNPYALTRFCLRNLTSVNYAKYDSENQIKILNPRVTNGFTKSRVTNTTVLNSVLRQNAIKLIPRTDGLSTQSYALYPYGFRSSTIKYLSEQQIKLLGFKQYGQDSLVNRVTLVYNETSLPLPNELLQTGTPRNFISSLNIGYGSGGDIDAWTLESYSRFGTRPNNNGWDQLDWVGNALTSSVYQYYKYLLQTFSRPLCTIEFEIPLFESDHRSIECMDIIELSHPDLPATFGTTPDSLTPLPVYSGAVVETANYGFPFRQAQSYRLQVYSRQVIFNIGGNKAAALRLGCRVLNNPYEIY